MGDGGFYAPPKAAGKPSILTLEWPNQVNNGEIYSFRGAKMRYFRAFDISVWRGRRNTDLTRPKMRLPNRGLYVCRCKEIKTAAATAGYPPSF